MFLSLHKSLAFNMVVLFGSVNYIVIKMAHPSWFTLFDFAPKYKIRSRLKKISYFIQ